MAATRPQFDVLGAIGAGGALGAAARYGVAHAVTTRPDGFPWATFWVNVSGALALTLFLGYVLERVGPTRYLRPFFTTGFVGAYTTFSTFAVETDLLVRHRRWSVAALYVVSTLIVGLASALAGLRAGRALAGAPRLRAEG